MQKREFGLVERFGDIDPDKKVYGFISCEEDESIIFYSQDIMSGSDSPSEGAVVTFNRCKACESEASVVWRAQEVKRIDQETDLEVLNQCLEKSEKKYWLSAFERLLALLDRRSLANAAFSKLTTLSTARFATRERKHKQSYEIVYQSEPIYRTRVSEEVASLLRILSDKNILDDLVEFYGEQLLSILPNRQGLEICFDSIVIKKLDISSTFKKCIENRLKILDARERCELLSRHTNFIDQYAEINGFLWNFLSDKGQIFLYRREARKTFIRLCNYLDTLPGKSSDPLDKSGSELISDELLEFIEEYRFLPEIAEWLRQLSKEQLIQWVLLSEDKVLNLLPVKKGLAICFRMISNDDILLSEKIRLYINKNLRLVDEDYRSKLFTIDSNSVIEIAEYGGFLWEFLFDSQKYCILIKNFDSLSAFVHKLESQIENIDASEVISFFLGIKDLKERQIIFSQLSSTIIKALIELCGSELFEIFPVFFMLQQSLAFVNGHEGIPLNAKALKVIETNLSRIPHHLRESIWEELNLSNHVVYNGFLWKFCPNRLKSKIKKAVKERIKERYPKFIKLFESYANIQYSNSISLDLRKAYDFDENDYQLIRNWLSSKSSNDFDIAKMLSARGAEKVAISFYKSLGYQICDISIHQVTQASDQWMKYDLLLNGSIMVDVKNSRGLVNNKKGYSEFCIPSFKTNRGGDVVVAGVLSPYLNRAHIEAVDSINFDVENPVFLGECKRTEIEELERLFNSSEFSIQIRRESSEKYLPLWLFDYPALFYEKTSRIAKEILTLSNSDFPELVEFEDLYDCNLIPLIILSQAEVPANWAENIDGWKLKFITLFSGKAIKRITLPYIFLSILTHFISMLSASDEAYHPKAYPSLLFTSRESKYPLGVCDPLGIVQDLCDTLSLLWDNRKKTDLQLFKIFKFYGRGLLRGKYSEDDRFRTIIAYCGGEVEGKGKCGYNPLVIGKDCTCSKCERLVCSKCSYCSENCINLSVGSMF